MMYRAMAYFLLVSYVMWQEFLLLFIKLDQGAHLLIRRFWPPQYVLLGACQRRGTCCQCIRFAPPRMMLRRPRLLALALRYHWVMHRFEAFGRSDSGEILFRCHHLQSDGQCGIYRYRPRLCRDYPKLPLFGPPRLLPGCGFQTASQQVIAMKQRSKLRIVNPTTEVHHPTPPRSSKPQLEQLEDFHQIDPHPTPRGV